MEINCFFSHYFNSYSCVIRESNIIEQDQVIKKLKGDHKSGKTNNDVERVNFWQTNVIYFPRGLGEHFPSFTYLDMHGCDIKKIFKSDLKGLEGLVNLQIVHCQLHSLPDDLLTEMPNLRTVSFSYNKIEFASSNLLKPLIGRENVTVSLQRNKNIDAQFEPGYEGSLESLEDLMKLIDEKCIKPIVVPDPADFNPKLKEMWISGKFSDLAIIAGEKKFKVHKDILGMQSEVFAEMFEDQNEATEIKTKDFSSGSVEALLKFIYTNEISEGNAKENFEIADQFKVAAMKSFYEKQIFNQLDDSNAEEMFLFAHRFSSQLLMEKAFHLIAEKFPELPIKILEDPEKLKKLIDARRDLDELLKDK